MFFCLFLKFSMGCTTSSEVKSLRVKTESSLFGVWENGCQNNYEISIHRTLIFRSNGRYTFTSKIFKSQNCIPKAYHGRLIETGSYQILSDPDKSLNLLQTSNRNIYFDDGSWQMRLEDQTAEVKFQSKKLQFYQEQFDSNLNITISTFTPIHGSVYRKMEPHKSLLVLLEGIWTPNCPEGSRTQPFEFVIIEGNKTLISISGADFAVDPCKIMDTNSVPQKLPGKFDLTQFTIVATSQKDAILKSSEPLKTGQDIQMSLEGEVIRLCTTECRSFRYKGSFSGQKFESDQFTKFQEVLQSCAPSHWFIGGGEYSKLNLQVKFLLEQYDNLQITGLDQVTFGSMGISKINFLEALRDNKQFCFIGVFGSMYAD